MTSLIALLLIAAPPENGAAPAPAPPWPKEITCAAGTQPSTSRGRPPPPPGSAASETPPEVTQFVCKDAAGRRQGRFLSRTDAGVTVAKGGFSDDKPEGLWTFYAADGTKAAEIPIAGGVPSGDMLLYYPSGKLRGRTREIPDGKTLINETFYESGAKASVHVIDKRAGAGEYTGFHENGTKAAEGRNAGNTRQGLWREWDATGKLVVTAEYDAQGNRTSCKGPGCEAKPAAGH